MVLIGNWMIIKKNKWGFALWFFGDLAFALFNLSDKNYPSMVVFLVYAVMGIMGYLEWKNDNTV